MVETIERVLAATARLGASDVHLKVGLPPIFRVKGHLRTMRDVPPITREMMESIADHIMNPRQKKDFEQYRECDLAYSTADGLRFRTNVFTQRGNLAMVLRLIPPEVPPFASLRQPEIILRLAEEPRGLVLVTGVTGDPTDPTDPGPTGPTFPSAVAHWELGAESDYGMTVPNTMGSSLAGEVLDVDGVDATTDRFMRGAGAIATIGNVNTSTYGYVEVRSFPAMSTVTIAGWVRGANNGNTGLIAGREDGVHLATLDGRAAVRIGDSSLRAVAPSTLGSGWSFVVATVEQPAFGALRIRLWVNGGEPIEVSGSGSLPTTAGTFYLGKGFHGGLDDFRVFDRALTPAEMMMVQAETDR